MPYKNLIHENYFLNIILFLNVQHFINTFKYSKDKGPNPLRTVVQSPLN